MNTSKESVTGGASRPSIRARLQVLLVLLILVLAATLLVAAASTMRDTLVRAAGLRARDAAKQVASLLSQSSLRGLETMAKGATHEAVARFVASPTPENEAAVRSVLDGLASAGPRRISLWSPDGQLLLQMSAGQPTESGLTPDDFPPTSSLPNPGLNLLQDAGAVVFSDAAVPVPADGIGDAPAAYLVVRTPVVLRPPDILSRIAGEDAAVLAGGRAGGTWTDFVGPVRRPPLGDGEDAVEYVQTDGSRQIGAVADVAGTPWSVWVELPRALVVAPAKGFLQRMGLVTLGIALVSLLLADIVATRVVARPLGRLRSAVEAIAAGDYARRVVPDDAAEIGALGEAFNSMSGRIQSDIAARHLAEETLRDREAQFRLLFASNPFPMWVYDLETLAFLEVNDAAVQHYGWTREEFLAKKITDIRPSEDVEKLLADLSAPRLPWKGQREWRHLRRSGAIIDVEITSHTLDFGQRKAVLVIAQDITERKRLEVQLWQARKLEAIGNLAGGIAHDFNNLLTVILGYAQMLQDAEDMSEHHRSDLEQIQSAAERAQDLTRQLLAFARRQVMQPRILEINAAVNEASVLLRKLLPESVEFMTPPAEPLGNVRMDPTQLEQILMNLTVNAADAMPRGGQLTIETALVTLDESYQTRHSSIVPGSYVMLAVSDSGEGMDEETARQIFEPFFTTKDVGKGTGLGLATVHGIVKQSGGDIWVYSEPGRGTTFKVYLPEAEGAPATETPSLPAGDGRGTETILLVEDNDAVRPIVRIALERAGYRVVETGHPAEALRIASDDSVSFDLLLSDVVMPETVGPALHRQLLVMRPGLRVLYMSGHADAAIVRQGLLEAGTPFIQKPFGPKALAIKVRQVLDAVE